MTTVDPSLVTIETVERLAARAHAALGEGRTEDVAFLLATIAEETTRRTCSVVKAQAVSDEIARQAAANVRRHLEVLGQVNLSKAAERETEIVAAAVGEHYNDHGIGVWRAVAEIRRQTGGGVHSTLNAVRAEYERRGLTFPDLGSLDSMSDR